MTTDEAINRIRNVAYHAAYVAAKANGLSKGAAHDSGFSAGEAAAIYATDARDAARASYLAR